MKNVTAIRIIIVAMGITSFTPGKQPWRASAEESSPTEAGKALFQTKCSPCHTIGGGKLVGPDLKGVTAIRDHAWLTRFISAPDKVLASGDTVASQLLKEYGGVAMPNLGLNSSQVDALIAYLGENTPKKTTAIPAASTEATKGDPQRGVKLFTGVNSFQRGGAPCLACHTVSGVAPLGGGSLGPDLTGIYSRLGAAGLPSVLATLPFPTMQPIYQSRSLTPEERGDLAALFRTAAGRQSVDSLSRIIVLAVVGFVLLLILTGVVWRKRLRSVRRVLVTEMTEIGGDRG